jgi:hypothetical protein
MASKKKPAADTPPEKILVAGLVKDDAKYLYYIEKNGDVVRMPRGVAKAKTEVILKTGLKRERGYMYYVDADGDISREPDSE